MAHHDGPKRGIFKSDTCDLKTLAFCGLLRALVDSVSVRFISTRVSTQMLLKICIQRNIGTASVSERVLKR